MGTKQSIYEKSSTLDYYKFNKEEYIQVKRAWSEIEINPQFHGNAYMRSESYPQYMKYFTPEPRLPVNFDARTTAKFAVIMEAIGYLILDFNNKPKQLDRFIGYLAMVHKDMRLNEQDMHNIVSVLFEYLLQTFPTNMTAQCREVMSKYMNNIITQLSKKMELFRGYDTIQSDAVTSKLPWKRYKLFNKPLIFGKTKSYWDEWKKQWDTRLDEWALQDSAELPLVISHVDEEDTFPHRSRFDDGGGSKSAILQRKSFLLMPKRRISDVSASKLELLSLSKTYVDEIQSPWSRMQTNRTDKRHQQQRPIRFSHKVSEVLTSSRERRRAKNLLRDIAKSQTDTKILHRPLYVSNAIVDQTANETISDEYNKKTMELPYDIEVDSKSCNTARERRRKRFNLDLE